MGSPSQLLLRCWAPDTAEAVPGVRRCAPRSRRRRAVPAGLSLRSPHLTGGAPPTVTDSSTSRPWCPVRGGLPTTRSRRRAIGVRAGRPGTGSQGVPPRPPSDATPVRVA
jgi:hypothetical protein